MQAKRKPSSFRCQVFDNQLLCSPSPLFGDHIAEETHKLDKLEENLNKLLQSCDPVEKFLEFNSSCYQENTGSSLAAISTAALDDIGNSDKIVGVNEHDCLDQYLVPFSLIERWGSAMGILIILLYRYFIFMSIIDSFYEYKASPCPQ